MLTSTKLLIRMFLISRVVHRLIKEAFMVFSYVVCSEIVHHVFEYARCL